jgi:hypothetical protein
LLLGHQFDSEKKVNQPTCLTTLISLPTKIKSNDKKYGSQNSKIGNIHLKWAFSEAAVILFPLFPKKQVAKNLEICYCTEIWQSDFIRSRQS